MQTVATSLKERQRLRVELQNLLGGEDSRRLSHEQNPRLSAQHHGLREWFRMQYYPERKHCGPLPELDKRLLGRYVDVKEWPATESEATS
jgi:hypothetical protein